MDRAHVTILKEREVIEDVGESGSGIERKSANDQTLGTPVNLKLPLPMKVRGKPKELVFTVVGKRKKPQGDKNKMRNKRRKMGAIQRDELATDVRQARIQGGAPPARAPGARPRPRS